MSCSHCGKQGDAALRRCSRCKQASYCGADCQREAWRQHKELCAPPLPLADERASERLPALPEGDLGRLLESSSSSTSPLHTAAGDGSEADVRLLLDSGVDVAAKDGSEGTALHSAARGGRERVTRILLAAKADVVATDCFQSTPLHLATMCGHAGVVAILLAAGAVVDSKNSEADTALHIAAGEGNEELVKILLDAGADPVNP